MKNGGGSALEDTARLLDLVPYITSHQGVAIDQLATQFGVTVEEITSDLMTLWMCGLPGYTAYELIDLSFDSGFVTISNAQTLARPRTLERNEALALILGLETLLEEIETSNVTLSHIIPDLISRLSMLIGEQAVLRVQAGTPASSSLRAEITSALESRKNLEITYHSTTRDEMSERTITPLEFISRNGVDYLDAFCLTSGGFRTFRLDRIEKLRTVATAAKKRGEHLPHEAAAGLEAPFIFTLNIFSRPRDVMERFSIEGHGENRPEIATVTSHSPEWAVREIMSFGADVVALSPPSLREQIRQRAARALRAYES